MKRLIFVEGVADSKFIRDFIQFHYPNNSFEFDIVETNGWTNINNPQSSDELIKNKKLPSAIFAASDPIAIGAMRALKQYDIKIPEDISIIGFDNIETTNYTDPPLTTVFAPTFDMGFMAARQLFDAFKHNENISPIKILLPCFLIERNSCI